MKPIDLLKRLIEYNTESARSNLELIHFIAEYLESFGFRNYFFDSPDTQKKNLYAIFGPEVPGGLMLSGHTDVVPVANQNWSVEPYQLTERDKKFYGRGTADMKGFLAQMLVLAREVSSFSWQAPLIFAFTYDEEIGCLGAEHLMGHLKTATLPKPKYAIIGEPSGFVPFRLHKGITRAKVQIKGIPGHSSKPNKGVNAIELASDFIQFFKKLAQAHQQKISMSNYFEVPYSTFNIGKIYGGTAANIIAPDCTFEIEFRSMPEENPLSFYSQFIQHLEKEWDWKKRGAEVKIDILLSRKPMLTSENNSLQHFLLKHSPTSYCLAAPYYTEGAIYNEAGIETLIFGPGNIDQAHREDEYIEVSDFFRGIDILKTVLQEITSS